LFTEGQALIGMVHLLPLPGSPLWQGSLDAVLERALEEGRVYREAGYDALIMENMHDVPYLPGRVGPETVAAMAVVGRELRALRLPLGVQVLAAANREALAVAQAAGAQFIRAEAFVFGHVADEGWLDAQAGELLRYRRSLGSDVAIFADIKKKHSAHALTADVSLVETAKAARFFQADGVVVTGSSTGALTAPDEVADVAAAVDLPVLVGSGVTPGNARSYPGARGLIVGSWVKKEGLWSEALDPERVRSMRRAVD